MYYAIYGFAQIDNLLGISYVKSSNENWGYNRVVITSVSPHFPAERAGLKPLDIIQTINGNPTVGMQLSEISNHLSGQVGSPVTLEIKSVGDKTSRTVTLTRQAPLPNNCITEGRLNKNLLSFKPYKQSEFQEYNSGDSKATIRDPEVNLEKYATFDFELTSQDNPIQEKQLAKILEQYLVNRGLKRDKENPDLLVFVYTFSGNEKQYVPPTQKIDTRYQYGYDIWSGWGNKQYIESHQEGGYTQVSYFATIKVAMMDAQKAKEQVKTPPIVWQSQYNATDSNPIDLSIYGQSVFSAMAQQYPVSNFNTTVTKEEYNSNSVGFNYANTYAFTGLCYDSNQPNKVVYVFPESPAEIAGIQVGDEVVSVNNRLMPESKKEMERYLYGITLEKEKKHPDQSVLDKPKSKAGFSYIREDYPSGQQFTPLQFQVLRNGNTSTFYVNPQEWIYASSEKNVYKIKETDYSYNQDHPFFMGLGYTKPYSPLYSYTNSGGQAISLTFLGLDTPLSRKWNFVVEDVATYYSIKCEDKNRSFLQIKFLCGPGFEILPKFYLVAQVGVGLSLSFATDDDKERWSFCFAPGAQWNIQKHITLFGRKNIGSNQIGDYEFGLRCKF